MGEQFVPTPVWQCLMCGQFVSERTLDAHEERNHCQDRAYIEEVAEMRAWTY